MRADCSALVFTAAIAFAQPAGLPTDQTWAARSGLEPGDIAAIRKLTGVPAPEFTILTLDTKSLRERNQVVLVESGNGHCQRPHVLTKSAETGWRELWIHPDPRGLCAHAPVPPTIRVVEGRIVIEIPIMKDPFIRAIPREVQTWTWNGTTYTRSEAP
jgi:hypothetical protein